VVENNSKKTDISGINLKDETPVLNVQGQKNNNLKSEKRECKC
jgi:hypothetical protein